MISQIEPVDLHVGARVRTRRRYLGLSQSDLANACGITFQQIQKYERGANRISASRIVQIGKVLSVGPAFFFAGLDCQPEGAEADAAEEIRNALAQDFEVARLLDALAALSADARKPTLRLFMASLEACEDIAAAMRRGPQRQAPAEFLTVEQARALVEGSPA
jgi:transcriptional regulator with XRE-family HTH domain